VHFIAVLPVTRFPSDLADDKFTSKEIKERKKLKSVDSRFSKLAVLCCNLVKVALCTWFLFDYLYKKCINHKVVCFFWDGK
jgi:hypothetical protein